MIQLFYTGASQPNTSQLDPHKSIGGYVSASPVSNDSIGNLFPNLSQSALKTGGRRIRCFVIQNTGSTILLKLWGTKSVNPKISYQIAFQEVISVDCGFATERIANEDSLPMISTWSDIPDNEPAALQVGSLITNQVVAIWIKQTIEQDTSSLPENNQSSCDAIYDAFVANEQGKIDIENLTLNFTF